MSEQQPFRMSKHALERALEMSVDGDEIRRAYETPECIYWSTGKNAWAYTRGRITLGVCEDRSVVTTVIWSSVEDWEADCARGGDLTGREPRSKEDMNHLRRQP